MLPQAQKRVYWEKQGQDKLCGVHCINSLLQGPYFNEIALSEIALELDSTEKQLMAAQGFESKEFLKFMAQESNNVADDGNYSFQVLAEALRRRFTLDMESVDSKINRNEDLSIESGFVCNSSSHWFSIRKIDGIWLNLNSTNRSGPEMVSDFYLRYNYIKYMEIR